jgi:hypothetical protein
MKERRNKDWLIVIVLGFQEGKNIENKKKKRDKMLLKTEISKLSIFKRLQRS